MKITLFIMENEKNEFVKKLAKNANEYLVTMTNF